MPPTRSRPVSGATRPCGGQATFSILVTYNTNRVVNVPITIPVGSVLTDASTDVPKSIPDNSNAGVNSTVTLAGGGTITDVDVLVNVTHTWIGDVRVTLRHPDATAVTLADQPGGQNNSGDNFTNTVFDDEANTAINVGAPPYTGRFRPTASLSALDGKPVAGTWTLNVADLASQDTGTLNSWSLLRANCGQVTPPPPGPPPPPPVTGPPARRRLRWRRHRPRRQPRWRPSCVWARGARHWRGGASGSS